MPLLDFLDCARVHKMRGSVQEYQFHSAIIAQFFSTLVVPRMLLSTVFLFQFFTGTHSTLKKIVTHLLAKHVSLYLFSCAVLPS